MKIYCAVVAVFFFAFVLSQTAWSQAIQRPNIVVFLVDDMGVMDTSVPFLTDEAGAPKRYPLNDFYRTPNMERLARGGIRFNQFYAMSVCSPTRISIMTGQNAARHRATNWINPRQNNSGANGAPNWNWAGLKQTDVTLPKLLRNNGYRTIHVGKGHFGPEGHEGAEPLNLGFDVNVAGAAFGAPGSYYAEQNFGHGTRRAHHAVPHLDHYHGSKTFLTEALTIEAKKRVTETVERGEPFYLYFSHYAVHAPFDSDPRFAAHYVDSGKPKNAQAFATLIEGMDKSLGDMLDHFEQLGIAENTLIFFLGDNGSDAPLGHQHKVACAAPLRGKKGRALRRRYACSASLLPGRSPTPTVSCSNSYRFQPARFKIKSQPCKTCFQPFSSLPVSPCLTTIRSTAFGSKRCSKGKPIRIESNSF